MSNQEILSKAFKQAGDEFGEIGLFRVSKGYPEEYRDNEWHACSVERVIFSHAFAEAFWGNGTYKKDGLTYQWWTHHLQQMVIEKDPIRYLEQFLVKEDGE